MLDNITWPLAFTIVASFTVIVGSAVTLIQRIFLKKPDAVLFELQTKMQNLKTDITIMDAHIIEMKSDDAQMDKRVADNVKETHEIFNKLERKIEKISDLIIELIRTQHE